MGQNLPAWGPWRASRSLGPDTRQPPHGLQAELSGHARRVCVRVRVGAVPRGAWQTGMGGSARSAGLGLDRSQSPREENFGGKASLPSPGLCGFSFLPLAWEDPGPRG